ncbi:MAG TPA: hypothetical protein VFG81_12885 [Anaerolineales bacterium]|jgi:hypothetical protein|nr:hypothetical protein [Anaerolineales bacterium]
MKADKKFQRKPLLSVLLTLSGILIGLLLALLAVWADYESTAYGFLRRAQASFGGVSCPIFVGRNESSVVSIKVSNPTDRTISPSVRTEISTPIEFDTKLEHIQLAPGEQMTLQRTVGPENVDLGMFIFVSTLVYSAFPLPDRQTTCGILMLPVSNGTLLLILGTALSLLFMAAGTYLLYKYEWFVWRSRSILFIVAVTVLAMLLAFMGWWLAAAILIILSILTLVITTGSLFTS